MDHIEVTEDGAKIFIKEGHHIAPTIWVTIFAATIIMTTLSSSIATVPMGLYGMSLLLLSCAAVSMIYIKRTLMDQYVLTEKAVGIHSFFPSEHAYAVDFKTIGYVYFRQTGIRWLLAKMHIIQYGDLCFCESVYSPPSIVFHNIAQVRKKYLIATQLIEEAKNEDQNLQKGKNILPL